MNAGRLPLLALLILLLLAFTGCESGAVSGALVWDGSHVYEEGELVQGQLLVLDGGVVVRQGARVTESVFVLGGEVEIAGEVDGEVALVGGTLTLAPTAVVGSNLNIGGGTVQQSPQATVRGRVLGESEAVDLETLFPERSPRQRLAWLLPEALGVGALAYVMARVRRRPLLRVSRASASYPVVCAAMGLLLGIVGPALLVLMAFTVLLIPVTLIALLLAGIVLLYSWAGLGLALGEWLRGRLDRNWSVPVAAFLGTFLFMAVTDLLVFVPFVGAWVGILATVVGLGAVFLTRFGLREFVPSYDFGPPEEFTA